MWVTTCDGVRSDTRKLEYMTGFASRWALGRCEAEDRGPMGKKEWEDGSRTQAGQTEGEGEERWKRRDAWSMEAAAGIEWERARR